MSIVFRKLDQSIFTLNKEGQVTCLACLGMEETEQVLQLSFSVLYIGEVQNGK